MGDSGYRQQLLDRVESLLSVLEVAQRRLLAHAGRPGTDPLKQRRTLKSLEGTIQICRRARLALLREEDWAQALRDDAPVLGPAAAAASSFGEYMRFRELGPMTREEVANADLDAICERLSQEGAEL
ncbi:MAG: hypothetical protein ISR76_09425 [Planctomycetes bacterium]|nr:hypothetical protein [Planctomycetota bacterium]